MKLSCEIIKDLLPLYQDDVCSKESRSMVLEHLDECTDCKNYLDSMNTTIGINDIERTKEQSSITALKGIKRKLLRKNVIISVISILSAIIVLLVAYALVFYKQTPIAYEEGLITVNKAYDGVIDIYFNGDDYYCSYAITRTLTTNGIEKTSVYIYYTDTIFTRYLSIPKSEEYQFSIGNSIMVDYGKNGEAIPSGDNVTAVYYLVDNYSNLNTLLTDEEFAEATSDAILLWEETHP